MSAHNFPENLTRLHSGEEKLRRKSIILILEDERMQLHLDVVDRAMELADVLRRFNTADEDLKVIQMLAMRMFNAFGASLKLALSGYFQNSALIMRDILETVFLIDHFSTDHSLIMQWRLADKKVRMKEFSPINVRIKLDKRDGFTTKKRAEVYELFSELAAHPTMKSVHMMRPQKNGDAVIGIFMERTSLDAVLSEMGRLAIQVGEKLDAFIPDAYSGVENTRLAFAHIKAKWIAEFYPSANGGM